MLTTTTRNSIYSPLYRLRRRHKRRNGNGRIPRERSSRSSGEVWRIEKQYPGFVAEMNIEKIMGEIKRAARRNPSDFSSQANSKQTCLQNLVFACIFLEYVSIFYDTEKPKTVEIQRKTRNPLGLRVSSFWCARGDLPAVRGGGSRLWSAPGAPFTPAPVQVPGIKKEMTARRRSFPFLVREGGLEPPRPEWTLEPESSESTNSTTRACCQLSYSSI